MGLHIDDAGEVVVTNDTERAIAEHAWDSGFQAGCNASDTQWDENPFREPRSLVAWDVVRDAR